MIDSLAGTHSFISNIFWLEEQGLVVVAACKIIAVTLIGTNSTANISALFDPV